MKNSKVKLLAITVAVLMLSGCATFGQRSAPPEFKVVAPEDHQLLDCPIDTPPKEAAYVNSSNDRKEDLLANYSIALLKNIGDCNVRLKALRNWKKEQLDIYKSGAAESAPAKTK